MHGSIGVAFTMLVAVATGSAPWEPAHGAPANAPIAVWEEAVAVAHGGALTASVPDGEGGHFVGIGTRLTHVTPSGDRLAITARSDELPGSVRALAVAGDRVLAAVGSAGLYAFERGSGQLEVRSQLRTDQPATDIVLRGDLAYLGEPRGLRAVRIGETGSLTDVGVVTTVPDATGQPADIVALRSAGPFLVAVAGTLLGRSLVVIDVTSPEAPVVRSWAVARSAVALGGDDGLVVVGSQRSSILYTIDSDGLLSSSGFEVQALAGATGFAIVDNTLLAVVGSQLLEYDLSWLPPTESGSFNLTEHSVALSAVGEQRFVWSPWGATRYARRSRTELIPGGRLSSTGVIDELGWAGACGVAKSWNGVWRMDPTRPEQPPTAVEEPSASSFTGLQGWGEFVLTTGGATRLLSCEPNGTASPRIESIPSPDGTQTWFSTAADGDGDVLYVVDVWPGTNRQVPEASVVAGRLDPQGTVAVGAKIELPRAYSNAPMVAAAGGRVVVAWETAAFLVAPSAVGGEPTVAELAVDARIQAVAITSTSAYLAVLDRLERFQLATGQPPVPAASVPLAGPVEALTGENDTVMAVVRRREPGEHGHIGAVYRVAAVDGGPPVAQWLADVPLETGEPQAHLAGRRMSITAGLAGVVWLTHVGGYRTFLPFAAGGW